MNPPEREEGRGLPLDRGGLQIWGDIEVKADAVVQGAIHGNVRGKEKIILTEKSSVSGFVEGADVRIEGEVQGGVLASGQVWLGPASQVAVRCQGRAVRIEPGARFEGDLQVG